MFQFHIPDAKDAQQAVRQADRYQRALQILRDGYTFWYDADLNCIAVCKPGRLSSDYIIYGNIYNLTEKVGCDCPDMTKSGEPCKHYIAAWIDATRKAEDAANVAMVEEYERVRANAGVHESLLPNSYPF